VANHEKIAVVEAPVQRQDLRIKPQRPQQHRPACVTVVVKRRLQLRHLRGNGDDRAQRIVQQPDPLRDLLCGLDHLPLGRRDHQLGGLE
jgi:hypothetical protein